MSVNLKKKKNQYIWYIGNQAQHVYKSVKIKSFHKMIYINHWKNDSESQLTEILNICK